MKLPKTDNPKALRRAAIREWKRLGLDRIQTDEGKRLVWVWFCRDYLTRFLE